MPAVVLPAVEEENSADEVEAEEHGQGQEEVHRDKLGADVLPVQGHGGPPEVEAARDGVDGAEGQLDGDLERREGRDGDPPVVHVVVYHEELWDRRATQSSSIVYSTR